MAAFLRRVGSYLLGVFVCVELVYLPLSNFIQFVPRHPTPLPDEILGRLQREGQATDVKPVQAAIDNTGHACDRWAEATGQAQGWSLFAPPPAAGTFLTLEVIAQDGTRTELRSRFEPADVDHFVRFDVLNYRLFYREMSYAIVYSQWKPDSFAKQGEEWRQAIDEHVTTFRRSLSAYVRWRIASELHGTSAREVFVNVRVFLPPNDGTRPEAATVPLARWDGERVVPFDPVTGRFAE
jgi:hypothetical protein